MVNNFMSYLCRIMWNICFPSTSLLTEKSAILSNIDTC